MAKPQKNSEGEIFAQFSSVRTYIKPGVEVLIVSSNFSKENRKANENLVKILLGLGHALQSIIHWKNEGGFEWFLASWRLVT